MKASKQQEPARTLVDVHRVAAELGVSRPTIWRWLTDQKLAFPRPIKVGPNSTRFVWSEIQNYIAARAAERREVGHR